MEHKLFIDIETYSSVDISTCGAYKYIESPDFEVLILGYAIDNNPVQVVDLLTPRLEGKTYEEIMPADFMKAYNDENTLLIAHNAVFERLSFRRIGMEQPILRWYCTSVKAAYCGLPLSLDSVSKVLDLKDKKLDTGKALIKYFSCPCKPTKINGGRTRNYPEHAPEKWDMYMTYNEYDVLSEREIYNILSEYEIPDIERKLYELDQQINDRGILVDMKLAESAIEISEANTNYLTEQAINLTGLSNPNSAVQIKKWIEQETGIEVASLAKGELDGLEKEFVNYPSVLELLSIRRELSKTSIKKYYAMINCAGSDDRVRGTYQFYGANRTGRWAGRLLQLQNLSKNHLANIDDVRELVKYGDYESVSMIYDDISDILSQLVRTALIAPDGMIFSVADFSAIEARVISWLAGEKWRMDVFRGDGKIYEATGSRMFGVPITAITKGSELRQKSKISELALGFGGSVGALSRMGGEKMGLNNVEMADLTRKWRDANPNIVQMWADIEEAAKQAIMTRRPQVCTAKNIVFEYTGDYLTAKLPSGRKLFYRRPVIRDTTVGRSTKPVKGLFYEGVNQETKQWSHIDTYGGKLTENIVQATARDLIGYAMLKLAEYGYNIVMHIHDEAIAEIPYDGYEQDYYNTMVRIMSTPPDWAKDLPLNADGYLTTFYKKD